VEKSREANEQYAKLMTSIHATPKVSQRSLTCRPLFTSDRHPDYQTAPVEFRTAKSTSTPSGTASGKPSPLQETAQQEQSPSLDSSATVGDDKALKPATTVPTTVKPAATKAKPAAKRGLKRL